MSDGSFEARHSKANPTKSNDSRTVKQGFKTTLLRFLKAALFSLVPILLVALVAGLIAELIGAATLPTQNTQVLVFSEASLLALLGWPFVVFLTLRHAAGKKGLISTLSDISPFRYLELFLLAVLALAFGIIAFVLSAPLAGLALYVCRIAAFALLFALTVFLATRICFQSARKLTIQKLVGSLVLGRQ